jgi:hypothetical protein
MEISCGTTLVEAAHGGVSLEGTVEISSAEVTFIEFPTSIALAITIVEIFSVNTLVEIIPA